MSLERVSSRSDFGVIIGRFQPIHRGHIHLIRAAMAACNKVIIVLGSAHQSRSIQNPWTWQERAKMIAISMGYGNTEKAEKNGLFITPVPDTPYNETAWIRSVQLAVGGIVVQQSLAPSKVKLRLFGMKKDKTSYYLNLFPEWNITEIEPETLFNATDVRDKFFDSILKGDTKNFAHPATMGEINALLQTEANRPEMQTLASDWYEIKKYQEAWSAAPYPPTLVTVDAVVVFGGYILLVTRAGSPGKGLLALPGGFLQEDERLEQAMLRELKEETKINLPDRLLANSIVRSKVYDAPDRSLRGRTITHAFLLQIEGNSQGLPFVKGSDDAAHAGWYALAEVQPQKLHEDHYHIIQDLLGLA
jgi:bifunctional NMN adenylyltransferase/nudix hydrolase